MIKTPLFSGFAAMVATTVVACVSGTVPARELWRLDPPAIDSSSDSVTQSSEGAPLAGAPLEVALYSTPGLYGEQGITYRVDESRYGTYRTRDWAMPLGEMLCARTTALLRGQHLASVVLESDASSPLRTGWRWEGTVREFDEVDRKSGVTVSVALDVVLRRAENDSVIWRGARRLERPVASPTMSNVVAELSATSDSVIVALARDAAPVLQGERMAAASRNAAAPVPTAGP
jgi:uncharacterized lipoprotein YmbA